MEAGELPEDDLLKLGIALLTGVFAFVGTWAGSRFNRVNEHRQWLRDQKMQIYRDTYEASQRWIESAEEMYAHADEYVKLLEKTGTVRDGVFIGPKPDLPDDQFEELQESWNKQNDTFATFRKRFAEYGLMPVEIVASKYVARGVSDVMKAVPMPHLTKANVVAWRDVSAEFRRAQSEMIERFREDLEIKDAKWRIFFRALPRRLKRTGADANSAD